MPNNHYKPNLVAIVSMNQQVKQFSESLLKTLVLNGKWAKMGKIKIKTSKKKMWWERLMSSI